MVTLADMAGPTSVARVDLNDLAATFGEGVRMKAVTLEITRAEVTEGIAEGVVGPTFCRERAKILKEALAGWIDGSYLDRQPDRGRRTIISYRRTDHPA